MIEPSSDLSTIIRDFVAISEFWIVKTYNGLSSPNLQKFVQITLYEYIDEWNISIVSELFNEFIIILFKSIPAKGKPLYSLGEIYRAFDNIFSFQITHNTFQFLKKKIIEGIIDADWIDIPFLNSYYRNLSNKHKKMRFIVRNIILLTLRIKSRKIKDIRNKFKSI